jgi:cysteine desulfurase/selenocysteine lyase
MEHHANFVPWQQLCKTHNLDFQTIPVTEDGNICADSYKKLLESKPAIVCLSHCSNVLGNITPIRDFVQLAKNVGALTMVDGTQAVPHLAVDVLEIGADFYTFTGHKMLGPTGIGVLTGKKESLELLSPSTFGGDMIDRVTVGDSTFAALPARLEAGTPPVAQAIGLASACDYLNSIGMHNIRAHEQKLLSILSEGLESIKEVQTYGAKLISQRSGICAFNVMDAHAHDISMVLDQMKVCVRSGDHCAQPLMTELGMQGSLRASIYIYNTQEDIERMLKAVQKAVKLFVK